MTTDELITFFTAIIECAIEHEPCASNFYSEHIVDIFQCVGLLLITLLLFFRFSSTITQTIDMIFSHDFFIATLFYYGILVPVFGFIFLCKLKLELDNFSNLCKCDMS